jgi:hypothetical protein
MSNEVAKRTIAELDGFSDFTTEVEGEEERASSLVIQGVRIKFIDPRWLDNAEQDITGHLRTAIGVRNVVNKWDLRENVPVETRILAPGERFPSFDKLNAESPQSEWGEKFGKMVGPWSGQHVVYFIDEHYNKYSWPSPVTTIGSAIAVRELADQITLVRKFRGANVFPVIELGHVDFRTGYGMRQRPYLLNIKDWIRLGPDPGGALPAADDKPEIAPPVTGGAPTGAPTVEPITAEEAIGDKIPF